MNLAALFLLKLAKEKGNIHINAENINNEEKKE
jgi:hypothetical protein